MPKAPPVPTGRPSRRPQQRRGVPPSLGVVLYCPGGAEGRRDLGRVSGKAGCGRRGRAEGRLRSFLPWERKRRNGEGAMCRNVGPLGEAGEESGKWGAGGTAGEMDQAPCPLPNRRIPGGAADEVILSGSPRATVAGCPLPPRSDPPHSNRLPPRGNVLWPKSFWDFLSRLASRLFCPCLNQARPANSEAHFLDGETEA